MSILTIRLIIGAALLVGGLFAIPISPGSRVKRTYDVAATPFRRLLASGVLSAEERERLEAIYSGLDPVLLLW